MKFQFSNIFRPYSLDNLMKFYISIRYTGTYWIVPDSLSFSIFKVESIFQPIGFILRVREIFKLHREIFVGIHVAVGSFLVKVAHFLNKNIRIRKSQNNIPSSKEPGCHVGEEISSGFLGVEHIVAAELCGDDIEV